jgi:hypothetical protein
MKYRLLWAAAIAGLLLNAVVAAREGLYSTGGAGQALLVAALALTGASLIAVAAAWLFERSSTSARRPIFLLRAGSLSIIAIATVASVLAASFSQDSSAQEPASTAAAATQLVANPAAQQATAEAAHVHTDAAATTTTTTGAEAPLGEGSAHMHGAEVPVTEEQLAAANKFVADVKATVAPYEDIRAGMKAGYVQLTQDLPGIAAHFVNVQYLTDGIIMDPTKPEFLLYTKRLDGNWRLVGTMFYDEKAGDTPPSFFGPLDAWHLHEDLCFTGPSVRIVTSAADCKGGNFVAKTAWQLHVWTAPGSVGVFSHDFAPISPGAFPGATKPAIQDLAAVPH